jgi:hypothetical protein
MTLKSLSTLSMQDNDVAIQVQVNRKWEYRGATDDGPIMHIDMILTGSTVRHYHINNIIIIASL